MNWENQCPHCGQWNESGFCSCQEEPKFINLTPHEICVVNGDKVVKHPASGIVARVTVTQKKVNIIGGIPIFKNEYGEIENLPHKDFNTYYIVSGMVLAAAASNTDRDDLLAPDTGSTAIRNEKGQVIAVRQFVTN